MKPRLLLATLLAFEVIGLTATVGGDPSSNLFNGIRNGGTVAVRAIAVRNINTTNAAGETPLMYAALYGEAATVKLLLSRGAYPNAKTTAGTTALMLASGDIEKTRMLVDLERM